MLGVVLGLVAAAIQSVAYVFSRLFVVDHRRSALQLLVASHLMMGVMALIALPLSLPADMPPVRRYMLPLSGVIGFFLFGQIGMFFMMRHTQASRVAPLLGFKIVILAFIASCVLGEAMTLRQWAGAALCVCATVILGLAGGKLSARSFGWLFVTCLGYSLSDISISYLVKSLHPLSLMRASVVGVSLAYTISGVLAAVAIPLAGGRRLFDGWQYSLSFSFFWLAGMVVLFACFAYVGVVYGNILQSTRGIISILIGACLARAGMLHIEKHASRSLLMGRIAAAAMMSVSIWLARR